MSGARYAVRCRRHHAAKKNAHAHQELDPSAKLHFTSLWIRRFWRCALRNLLTGKNPFGCAFCVDFIGFSCGCSNVVQKPAGKQRERIPKPTLRRADEQGAVVRGEILYHRDPGVPHGAGQIVAHGGERGRHCARAALAFTRLAGGLVELLEKDRGRSTSYRLQLPVLYV